MNRLLVITSSLVVIAGVTVFALAADPAPKAKKKDAQAAATADAGKPSEAAIERSRKTVRMLDDIYKQVIVLITDKYVETEEDFAAGSAAVLLFENLSKSENQKVRLLDATGEPYDEDNVAKDAFEKEGIKRIKAGAKGYEQIVEEDGKYSLRSMTPVPVVLERCIMCHPHYKEAQENNQAIGAISYRVPIE
jgi:hypothetical protein